MMIIHRLQPARHCRVYSQSPWRVYDCQGSRCTHDARGVYRRAHHQSLDRNCAWALASVARVDHEEVGACWLSRSSQHRSLEAGKWLDEAPFEIADKFPAARSRFLHLVSFSPFHAQWSASRLERAKSRGKYRQQVFSSKSVFVSSCSLPKTELERLLLQCGAEVGVSRIVCFGLVTCMQVVASMDDAELIVSDTAMPGVRWKVVTDKWVLDSVCQHEALVVTDYLA